MKKIVAVGIGLLVIIGVAGLLLIQGSREDKPDTSGKKTASQSSSDFKVVDACAVVTQAVADKVLGTGAEKGVSNGDTSTDDINVSTCTYTLDTNTGLPISADKIKSLTLLARSAKSAEGIDSNAMQLSEEKPTGAESVSGYGTGAYWDPQYGQLNIFKNGSWYILTNGSSTLTARTLDDAKLFADQIVSQL